MRRIRTVLTDREVSQRRGADPILDEVCQDAELLLADLETIATMAVPADPGLVTDIQSTLAALEGEIRLRLRIPASEPRVEEGK